MTNKEKINKLVEKRAKWHGYNLVPYTVGATDEVLIKAHELLVRIKTLKASRMMSNEQKVEQWEKAEAELTKLFEEQFEELVLK